MKILIALKNGVEVEPAKVSYYLDRSYQDENGVYEAIQTYNNLPFRLDEHLLRLEQSIKEKTWDTVYSVFTIKEWILDVIAQAQEANQFLIIIAEPEEVVIISRKLEPDKDIVDRGFKVITSNVERPDPQVKSLESRAISAAAINKAKDKGFDETILVNHEGICTEGAYSNLFWTKDGQVFTSKEKALAGITQQAVIEAIASSYNVQFGILHKDEINNQDELFLTSSRIGVAPVVEVDGTKIGNGNPGPITKNVVGLFEVLTQRECSV